MAAYVYIMSNKKRTVLYTGVTSDLFKRVYQHKNHLIDGFSSRYNCEHLIYYEEGNDITAAIAREKQIKSWSRKKKENLIAQLNPAWSDLSNGWYGA